MPIQAVQADFLSSLSSLFVGDQAYAETKPNTVNPPKSEDHGDNLQNIALLEADVSSVSSLQNKTEKSTKKKDDIINTSSDINIVSETSLLPATGPMGVSDGTYSKDISPDETSVYVVRKGDSVSQIADMFNVSVNTILTANDMKKGDKLVESNVLFILPISGVKYVVAKGDTLKSIAKDYKVGISEIAQFNAITEDAKLAIGDELIIPGGEMVDEGGDKPAPNLGSAVAKDTNYYLTHPIQALLGYFINPVPTGSKTQGLHGPGNRGIDIGAPTGTPIYASASGTVLIVKSGCQVGKTSCGGGYGNMIIIQHSNGTKTLYGHMSKLGTSTGARVSQGQVIGYVGSTGHSTGPHIHFEVYNAKNPGSNWSWAN